MQLCNHNHHLEQALVSEMTAGKIGGKYRKLDWRFRNLKKPAILQPTVSLTYRGIAYNQSNTTESENLPVSLTQKKARRLMSDKERTIKNRQLTMLCRSAAEIGLHSDIAS